MSDSPKINPNELFPVSEGPNEVDKNRTPEDWARLVDVLTDIMVYPKSVLGGEHAYEKRSRYMEGWNDCAQSILDAYVKFEEEEKEAAE